MKLKSTWLIMAGLVAGCAQVPDDPEGYRIAFEDPQAQRIAVIQESGKGFEYITPDSLTAFGPVSDSSWTSVYFIGRSRRLEEGLHAIYAVEVDGTYLRKITDLPLSPMDLQVTPDGGILIFVGRYPDEENPRVYQMSIGESGFHAVTPASRSAMDPFMAPGGLNFIWHDGKHNDTLLVSSLQQILTLPIYEFPYTQVSIRPDGMAFAAICGEDRRGLCFMALKSPDGQDARDETVLVPETDGVSLSHPIFHPDGVRIAYVRTELSVPPRSSIRVIDRNSLEIKEIPTDLTTPTHPVWVR